MEKHIVMVLLLINSFCVIQSQNLTKLCVELCSYDFTVFTNSDEHSIICLRPIEICRYKGKEKKQEAIKICKSHYNTYIESGPIRNVSITGNWWIQSDTLFLARRSAYDSFEQAFSNYSDTTKYIIEKNQFRLYNPVDEEVMKELMSYPNPSELLIPPTIYKRKYQIKEP